jgi:hypothetical protein
MRARGTATLLLLLVLGGVAAALDEDGDGFADEVDTCPELANPEQLDSDADGLGNRCDNCVRASNPEQADADGDGVGDACDLICPDTEDVPDLDGCDLFERCPCEGPRGRSVSWPSHGRFRACVRRHVRVLRRLALVTPEERRELVQEALLSGCGRRRALPGDRDGDGIQDDGDESGITGDFRCRSGARTACDDNCPRVRNANQPDADGDALGDTCDPDRDGDARPNDADNCPRAANPDQGDGDGDEVGDTCDDCQETPEAEEVDGRGCSETDREADAG